MSQDSDRSNGNPGRGDREIRVQRGSEFLGAGTQGSASLLSFSVICRARLLSEGRLRLSGSSQCDVTPFSLD